MQPIRATQASKAAVDPPNPRFQERIFFNEYSSRSDFRNCGGAFELISRSAMHKVIWATTRDELLVDSGYDRRHRIKTPTRNIRMSRPAAEPSQTCFVQQQIRNLVSGSSEVGRRRNNAIDAVLDNFRDSRQIRRNDRSRSG